MATLVLPAGLSAGPHSVVAAYQGGGSYVASSTTLAVPVGQAGSTTQVVASATSVALGQPVTLTATVAAVAPGVATATGMVRFFDGGTLLGTAPLLAGGQAVFTTTTLGVGPHMLTATFGGNGDLTGSTATAAAVTVTKGTPTVSLVAFGQHLRPGQATTLVVDVTGPVGAASGTVTFLDNGSPVSDARLNGGVAIFTTAKLHRGVNVFTIAFGGDGNDQPATSNAVHVVLVTRKQGHGGHNRSRPRVRRLARPSWRGRPASGTDARSRHPLGTSLTLRPDRRVSGSSRRMPDRVLLDPAASAFPAPGRSVGSAGDRTTTGRPDFAGSVPADDRRGEPRGM